MTNRVSLMPRRLAIAAVCLLATACRPEPVVSAATAMDAAASAPAAGPAVASSTSAAATWEEGMAYATLRSRLLAAGWAPLPDAQCRANVVGDNHATLCAADPQRCQPCDALPELSACSGTGHCTMHFQGDGGQRLSVSTYGDVHRRSASSEPEDLVVTDVEPAGF